MEDVKVEAAVARFIDFMTSSAEEAADLAKKGADVGMTLGSELVQQVLLFNGIKAGVLGLVFLTISALLIKCGVKGVKAISQGTGSLGSIDILDVIPDYEPPSRNQVRAVITKTGKVVPVHGIDHDGDARKSNGDGYVWRREIKDTMSQEQRARYLQGIREMHGGGRTNGLIAKVDDIAGLGGSLSLTVVVFIAGFGMATSTLNHFIEVLKITTAPYLYLMEYAVELKDKV